MILDDLSEYDVYKCVYYKLLCKQLFSFCFKSTKIVLFIYLKNRI